MTYDVLINRRDGISDGEFVKEATLQLVVQLRMQTGLPKESLLRYLKKGVDQIGVVTKEE